MSHQVITRILTAATFTAPAGAYDLTTLANARTEFDIPTSDTGRDLFLRQAIRQASATIAGYCNRVFPVETVEDQFLPGRGTHFLRANHASPGRDAAPLVLSRFPVTELAYVNLIGQSPASVRPLIEDRDFALDADGGMLVRLDGSASRCAGGWEGRKVTVGYNAGYAVIPADLEEACLILVTERFHSRGRDPALRERDQPNIGRETWWVGGPPKSGTLPDKVVGILENYRKRLV